MSTKSSPGSVPNTASAAQRIRWDVDTEKAAPERPRTGFKQENSALPRVPSVPSEERLRMKGQMALQATCSITTCCVESNFVERFSGLAGD